MSPGLLVAAYPLADRTPESLAEDVIRYGAAGWKLLKVARDPDPGRMSRWLETAATGLPAGTRLVVDAGYGWRSSEEALAEIPLWGDVPLAWLEDPLVPEDAAGCAAIRRGAGIRSASATRSTHIGTFSALLDADALDVLRVDVPALGGVTPARRVQALAESAGYPSHSTSTPSSAPTSRRCSRGRSSRPSTRISRAATRSTPRTCSPPVAPCSATGPRSRPEAPGLGFELDRARFGW